MKKILLLSAILISVYGHAQSLLAVPDTFTVLQATVDTFAVTHNDSIPAGDSVCITLFDTASRFSVLNCRSIIYHPDSTFTGRDTCRYVLCDTAHICDTTMVVVYVDSLNQLLPVAGFKDDTILGSCLVGEAVHLLFNCNNYCNNWGRGQFQLSAILQRSDSLHWVVRDIDYGTSLYDSVKYYYTDTINFNPSIMWYPNPDPYPPFYLEVCLTVYNQYGSTTFCDTSCQFQYEGIAEVPLSNIHLYPNPADRVLTIDMRQNTNPMSADYAAIGIYNALGQKVRSIPRHDSSRLVEVAVTGLPEGIYISTIVDARGTEMVLGRFTVVR